jgi:hypothetical protein
MGDKYGSEVSRLRQSIEEEIEAMHRGFSSVAAGAARHEFIRARMECISSQQDLLAEHVGSSSAAHMVCELYINSQNRLANSESSTF